MTATSGEDGPGPPRRKRRPPGEARRLLVEAAQRRFTSQGYGGTSTRYIAEDAAVSEGLLFRYFGTKKQLFNEAVVQPFADEAAAYVADFDPRSPARPFQEGLFELLDRNREVLMAVLTAETFEDEVVELADTSALAPIVRNLEGVLDADVELYGFEHVDSYTTARLVFAMNLGLTFFFPWLFEDAARRPDRATLIRAMLVQVVHGLAHRPPPAADASPPSFDKEASGH